MLNINTITLNFVAQTLINVFKVDPLNSDLG